MDCITLVFLTELSVESTAFRSGRSSRRASAAAQLLALSFHSQPTFICLTAMIKMEREIFSTKDMKLSCVLAPTQALFARKQILMDLLAKNVRVALQKIVGELRSVPFSWK